jgi:hypothetical protein
MLTRITVDEIYITRLSFSPVKFVMLSYYVGNMATITERTIADILRRQERVKQMPPLQGPQSYWE